MDNRALETNHFGDRYFPALNGPAFQRLSAESVIAGRYGDLFRAPNHMAIFIGSDSGLLIEYLLQREIPATSQYIFIELPEWIDTIRAKLGRTDLGPNIHLCNYAEWFDVAMANQFDRFVLTDHLQLRHSLAAADGHHPGYAPLWGTLTQDYRQVSHNITQSGQMFHFERREIENLCENRVTLRAAHGIMAGRTAILLGAGPSVRESIDWIKANRGSLDVIAVSRVTPLLEQEGITPDFVTSVDPHEFNFDYGKGIFSFLEGTTFLHSTHVTPALRASWHGPALVNDFFYPWRKHQRQIFGATVSSFSLRAADELGYETVLLAGIDLCFTRDRQTHVRSKAEPVQKSVHIHSEFRVETYAGYEVDTNQSFFNERFYIAEAAARFAASGRRVINLSESAARIDNIDYRSRDRIELPAPAQRACTLVTQTIEERVPDSLITHYRKVKREVEATLRDIQAIEKLIDEALTTNKRILTGSDESKNAARTKLDKLEAKLDQKYPELFTYIKKIAIFDLAPALNISAEGADDATQFEFGRIYYGALKLHAGKFREALIDANLRTASRLDEEKSPPPIGRLVAQWSKDHQPGRARAWRLTHTGQYETLDEADRERLAQLEAEFNLRLTTLSEELKADVDSRTGTLTALERAITLYEKGDRTALEKLRDDFSSAQESDARALTSLAMGLIDELADESASAIRHYLAVAEAPFREQALRRCVNLMLKRQEYAEADRTFAELAAIDSSHKPHRAELKRILGQTMEAIEILTEYVTERPDDIGTLVKLALLYKEAHLDEGIKLVANYILELDAENLSARTLLEELEENKGG